MKKILLTAILIVFGITIHAQTFQWAKRIGSAGNDVALAITTDASGNVYSTGYFTGTVDLDPGPATLTFTAPSGSADIFISKFTSTGNLIWAKQIGGSSFDQGNSIKVDASGNVYVGGTFATTVDFDPGAGIVSHTVVTASDAFILKLDATGNFVWVSVFGGTGNEQVTALDLDASGNVLSTGFWYMTCDFDPGPATYSIQASIMNSQSSAFISKLDNAGNFIWAGEIGGGQFHEGHAIAVDATGNVYVGGHAVGGTDYNPGAGNFNLPGGGSEEAFIVKLDAAGAFITAVKPVGTGLDRLNGLELDASGNVISTGFFSGTVDFDPGAGTVNLTSVGLKDIFILKLNSSLGYVWARGIGGTADDMGNGIMSDASDNIYTTGYYQGTPDFDPGAGTSTITSSGGYDAFISKLNSTGAFVFGKHLGGTAGDYGFGIDVNATGNSIYTVGHFGGTCDFDPDAGVSNLVSGGTQNLFIQKMGICVLPSNPTNTTPLANQTVCSNNTATLSASGTGAIGWYSASTGGTYLGGGTNFITSVLTTTTNFFVQDSTCGASPRTQITVTVIPSPTVTVNSGSICSGNSFTITPSGASTYTFQGGSAIKTPTANASYTVVGTSTAGCVSSAFATSNVTVIATPTITVNSGSICSGNSFTIVPGGASTYTIQGGGAVKTPTATTSYTVIGTSTAGCVSSSFATSNVTVNATPTITVNSGSICAGNSFTIVPSGASTYTIQGGGAVKTPTATTSYTVVGTSAGCVSSSFATSNVTVNANPTITVNSGSICSGNSFTIVPSGASTYTIQGGGAIKTPTATTSYTVVGTSTAGCVSSSFATSNVTVNATPIITVAGGAICPGNSFTLTPTGASTYTFSSGSSVVSPTTTTSYSVSGTSTAGCVSTVSAVATITVAGTLTITITGNNSVCLGQAISLTGGGATTYTWSTGATTSTIAPTPTMNTTYTVTGASGSCSNTAVKSITVNPLPTISATTSNSLLCAGQSATLMANGASTYTWNPGGASTNISVSPTITTNYTVVGTDANGCSDFAVFTQSVSACTSLSELSSVKVEITVYPNPTYSILNIKTVETIEAITVFNLLGTVVLEEKNNSFSVEQLPAGIYTIQIKTVKGIGSTRFVKD